MIFREIFNPQNALLLACPNDRRRFFPNPGMAKFLHYHSFLYFEGVVLLLHRESRSPSSLLQPKKGGRWRCGIRRVVDYLIQWRVQSSDFYISQIGSSKKIGDRGRGIVNAVSTDAETSAYERQVICEVEAVSWRERHISASIRIDAIQERVWEVLTDYGSLAEFIPNLTHSEQIPCPHPGRKWLLQEGKQTTMYWQIEAQVVLDLEELPDAKDGKEVRFSMVDGDFKYYVGRWYFRPDARYNHVTLQGERDT